MLLLSSFFGFSILLVLSILLGKDLLQIEFNLKNSDAKKVHESWSHEDVFSRKPFERVERSVHIREPDTTDRFAESDDSKNSSLVNVNKTAEHVLLLADFKRVWPVSRWTEHGYFSEDYLDLINDHWLQFAPPNETSQKILGVVYLLFATVGCWGNIIVLFMYLR